MIELFSGTPGSGKSLHVAKLLYETIHYKDKPCIGNFYFKGSMCRPKEKGGYLYLSNQELTPDKLVFFSEDFCRRFNIKRIPEDYITLVIDEAQLIFNAREWSNQYRPRWISFFTQHRKLGYHVIVIAQFGEMIDKQVRALFEYELMHRKVSNIGIGGKIFSIVGGGNLHVCVRIYSPLKLRVSSEWFRADPNFYQLYDTYSRF